MNNTLLDTDIFSEVLQPLAPPSSPMPAPTARRMAVSPSPSSPSWKRSKDVQRPSGDTVLIARLEISPQGLRLALARESRFVQADDPLHVRGVIVEELDPQVPGSVSDKAREVLGRGLGDGVEQGIPAADIGFQRVLDANAIAQLDVVMVTGTAAIGLVGSWRKEGTVDAVLHVKHGDLLVDYHLEPIWRHGVDQVEELGGVEIVRGCDSHGPPTLEELDGQG